MWMECVCVCVCVCVRVWSVCVCARLCMDQCNAKQCKTGGANLTHRCTRQQSNLALILWEGLVFHKAKELDANDAQFEGAFLSGLQKLHQNVLLTHKQRSANAHTVHC